MSAFKEACDYLLEWAARDEKAANSLCMHSNNPSPEVMTFVKAAKVLKRCVDYYEECHPAQQALAEVEKILNE